MEVYKTTPIFIKISARKTLVLYQTTPYIDECKILLTEVLKQAIRDFFNFSGSTINEEVEIYKDAVDFLFDDRYEVDWGGHVYYLSDFLDILDININWFRARILAGRVKSRKKLEEKVESILIGKKDGKYSKCSS